MRQPNRLEHTGHAERRELAGEDRLGPRCRDVTLRGQVVDLVRLSFLKYHCQRVLVQQVGRDNLDSVQQVLDPLVAVVTSPPHDPEDAIPLAEQVLGQIGRVLSSDAGDEGSGDESGRAGVAEGGGGAYASWVLRV